ncbi:hypothetical protein CMQ_8009 [Grosmannia clavigera kw1407]|uniref:Uncharacterized protein n=1 Tax=Grosmannia clavigera (strain kw1407 / UAMH 11150) TaxID=655863 RepID=F0XRS3_GROCL|nr:uncharacterized protein CMQ_8009 [Grosmannia clavigera kw1407]EFW99641.1 hypothetical protein CMQ_8009 [Grosmannia clavigera kw1407]
MATAALADASRKDRRRKDLDQRITEAREDLARVLRESSLADCNTALNKEGLGLLLRKGHALDETSINLASHRKVVEGLRAICDSPGQLLRQGSEMKHRNSYSSWLHEQFGLQRRWWTQRPAANAGLDDIEALLLAEEYALMSYGLENEKHASTDAFKQREPQTPLQFTKMTEATNQLVDELLGEANRLGYPDDIAAQKASKESLDSPWTAIRMLRSDGYPMYRHPDLAPEAAIEARLAANTATRKIFQDWEYTRAYGPSKTKFLSGRRQPEDNWYRKQIKFWVAKLCYNMLVSTAPPGIYNYNALILGFTRVGEHSLAGLVVNSLLYQSRLLPTQQTLVCLLQHYRAQGDLVGFYKLIRRLVAEDSRGAKIRRRSLIDMKARPYMMGWANTHDVTVTDGFVVQRAEIDGPVFNAILTGLLSLGQVRHAAVAFASFLSDCYEIKTGAVNWVVNCVLDAVDVPAARVLLRGFVENASRITPLLMSEERYARKLSIKIQLLLSVASVSGPSGQVQTQHQNLGHGYDSLVDDNCQRIAHALFVSDTLQYVKRLRQIVLAAQGAVTTDEALFRMSARSWSVQFDSLQGRQTRLDQERSTYRKMAELTTIDEAARTIFRVCAHVMETFLVIVSDGMDISDLYRKFLRQSELPFMIRFESYVATSRKTATPAPAESRKQASMVERMVVVDGPAVGGFLEDRFKHILLSPLSPDDHAAAGIDATRNMFRDVALDAVLEARALHDLKQPKRNGGAETQVELSVPQAKEETQRAVRVEFGSRYPYGLFQAGAILPNN